MTCLLVSFSGAVWCFLLRLDRVRLAVSAPGSRFIFYGNVFSTGAHQTIPLKAVNTVVQPNIVQTHKILF